MILIMVILMQFPTPVWPDLPAPTPYRTPTPAAMIAPIDVDQPGIMNDLATAQAQVDAMPTQIFIQGNQAYFGGRPILPGDTTQQAFSLFKWLTSTAGYSIFGPFQPIMIHLLALVTVALVSLVIYYGQLIVVTLFRFVWFIISLILRLIPFIG